LNPDRNNSEKKEKIMAVVRSLQGTFYDIPDDELENYKVPADKVKSLMEAAGQQLPQSPGQQPSGGTQQRGGGGGGQPQILVQFIVQSPGGGTPAQGQQPQGAPAEGEEKVEPQWYWINWANWANWYNWY
jgi:hypothetical protein